ncbi:Tubby-like F-box protein [Rhynchospora pubera]|uniref:Tubby-like F-box protein n=1 Tax=Rhynchospora pubera TaxID=906938 RepID=A0AAV8DWX6_9POAL|nr:Tubby-like F-box protein [Rhynchospora pubera]
MSFRSIMRDVKESLGSISRRSFEVKISGLSGVGGRHRGRSGAPVVRPHEEPEVVLDSENRWAGLPPELLREVVRRLEESEGTWPNRKNVVACAAVCRSWREMCKEMVMSPELCGKLTFPVSLKQPGPRDGTIQCFIMRDKSKLTYHLYLCLSPAVLVENGKFLLSAKRTRRTTYTEYIISMDSDNISRSSCSYIGKMRSNFLGTKFMIYDAEPPNVTISSSPIVPPQAVKSSKRFSKKVSPKVPSGNYRIADVSYELNVLGTRGPRRMHCVMNSIPASAVGPGGSVPTQPDQILAGPSFEESFRSNTTAASVADRFTDFPSTRFSDMSGRLNGPDETGEGSSGSHKVLPLVLRNKAPRWHEQLQCWCLNFRGRVTVASVKNFQLIAAAGSSGPTGHTGAVNPLPAAGPAPPPSGAGSASSSDHDKIILQFGKVAKDMFTMDYRYPLSAFQAFAICLTSFDTKLACE